MHGCCGVRKCVLKMMASAPWAMNVSGEDEVEKGGGRRVRARAALLLVLLAEREEEEEEEEFGDIVTFLFISFRV